METLYCQCAPGFDGNRCQYRTTEDPLMEPSDAVKRSSVKLSSLLDDFILNFRPFRKQTTFQGNDDIPFLQMESNGNDVSLGLHQVAEKRGMDSTHEEVRNLMKPQARNPLMFLNLISRAAQLENKFGLKARKTQQRRKAYHLLRSRF